MKKILYIDDDQDQLDIYKMSFGIHAPNIEFYTETNPLNAVKRIREIKPDAILLDLVMNQMSGEDVVRAIRKEEDIKDIIIIAFTNSMLTRVAIELNKLGVTEIWEKIKSNPKEFAQKASRILNV